MENLRFSREKRLCKVTFAEFSATAGNLAKLVQENRPQAVVEVFAHENYDGYALSRSRAPTSVKIEVSKERVKYPLKQFTFEAWKRSFNVSLVITDTTDLKPFMTCLSCDRHENANVLMFYGQGLDQRTHDQIMKKFRKASLLWSISDGFGKPLRFALPMTFR